MIMRLNPRSYNPKTIVPKHPYDEVIRLQSGIVEEPHYGLSTPIGH